MNELEKDLNNLLENAQLSIEILKFLIKENEVEIILNNKKYSIPLFDYMPEIQMKHLEIIKKLIKK